MYKVTIQTSGQMTSNNSGCAPAPLLSDLYIQIPKPQPIKKVPSNEPPSLEWIEPENHQKASDSHCFIFSGTRTKNSSASLPFKSESEIISDWVRSLFQKRGLLGPVWEQKFQLKRKNNLSMAFAALKEYQPPQSSGYLQTQSRYKPPLTRKVNNLLVMGIEKLVEVLPRLQLQRKQNAFSQFLRYLAFHHMNTITRCRSQEIFSIESNKIKESRHVPASPRFIPFNASQQEYELQKNYFQPTVPGRPQKYVPRFQNQYALTPFTESLPKELEASRAQKSPRSSRYVPFPPSMRESSNSMKMEIPMKQSFHIRGEHYHQEHRNTYEPQRQSQQYGPPPPTNIRFTPISTPQVFFPQPNQPPQQHNPQMNFNGPARAQQIRSHERPHTYNPFPNRSSHKDHSSQNKEVENAPQSRSRAVSASPNVKISFMGVTSNPKGNCMMTSKHDKANIPNDYEGQLMRASNVHKLGSAENKQMRHKYQINSWDNELVPQDHNKMPNYTPLLSPMTPNLLLSPMTPNPLLSPMTPNYMQSPKQKLMLSPQRTPIPSNGPLSPQIAPSSPRMSMNRPSPRVNRQLQPRSPINNDYNMRKREKLTVTASRRRQ